MSSVNHLQHCMCVCLHRCTHPAPYVMFPGHSGLVPRSLSARGTWSDKACSASRHVKRTWGAQPPLPSSTDSISSSQQQPLSSFCTRAWGSDMQLTSSTSCRTMNTPWVSHLTGGRSGSSNAAALCTHTRAGFALSALKHLTPSSSSSFSAPLHPQATSSSGCSSSIALCAAGPLAAAPLLQSASLTRNQLLRGDRKPKPKRRNPTKALKGGPQRKGICVRVYTVPPKKPNSANRTIAKVALSTGVKVVTYVPGEGHNLQVGTRVLALGVLGCNERRGLVNSAVAWEGLRVLPIGGQRSRNL